MDVCRRFRWFLVAVPPEGLEDIPSFVLKESDKVYKTSSDCYQEAKAQLDAVLEHDFPPHFALKIAVKCELKLRRQPYECNCCIM